MRKTEKVVLQVEKKTRAKRLPSTAFKAGNEHQWVKGQSGNPSGGRPPDQTKIVSKALRTQLNVRAPDAVAKALSLDPGASWAMCIAASLIRQAVKGEVAAAREIREAVEGSRSTLEIEESLNTNGQPLFQIEFVASDGNGRRQFANTIDALPAEQRLLSSDDED
jgi:hypothetical protein